MKQLTILFLFISSIAFSQKSIKEVLKEYNTESVPYISIKRASALNSQTSYLLDARELREFKVSHLKNAIHVGYDEFDLTETIKKITDKKAIIVVYCTLGVRSEDIAEKLKKVGYLNVFNLFGGIVEWKNEGYPVIDSQGKETERVHVVNKNWGKWLKKGKKVY